MFDEMSVKGPEIETCMFGLLPLVVARILVFVQLYELYLWISGRTHRTLTANPLFDGVMNNCSGARKSKLLLARLDRGSRQNDPFGLVFVDKLEISPIACLMMPWHV